VTPRPRILIFIVSYNAEKVIVPVLDRIPKSVWENTAFDTEVLLIDDQSADQTYDRAYRYAQRAGQGVRLTVLCNPKNQGYGGNQKIGYHYAVENGFEAVVLLHGDGQYSPEYLELMLLPILQGEADVVLGSRMLHKGDALRGRMPLYKWIGNQILTSIQNRILGSHLAEFHTGYRAYRVAALAAVPFEYNSDYFDFDTDILIQMLDTGQRIREIPIPTYYGDETSRVNGWIYGALILRTSLLSRIMRWGVFFHPKFDYARDRSPYTLKLGYPSTHEFALARVRPGSTVLDVGSGPGFMARELVKKSVKVISIDQHLDELTRQNSVQAIEADVETCDFDEVPAEVDAVLLLDILEHLRSPDTVLKRLRARYCETAPEFIVTTGNIAFGSIRAGLFLGQFNYGKRGILDLTHTRLFTFASLRQLLVDGGYEIVKEAAIPAPFPLAVGSGVLGGTLVSLNSLLLHLNRGLFAYQIAIIARPKPTLALLLKHAYQAGAARAAELEKHDVSA
jgi:glycosyltransferase involved in cell wall biosynthesis